MTRNHRVLYEIVFFITRYCGVSYLFKRLITRRRVTIVVYHNPKSETFSKHIEYLSKRYTFIPLSTLDEALYSSNWEIIPDHAMVVTFDDGWKENVHLLEALRKYNVNPTIFLTSHLIDTQRKFWWTACYPLKKSRLKQLATNVRLDLMSETTSYFLEKEFYGSRQVLNLSEIDSMIEDVEYGSHTAYHPLLTRCNENEKDFEISESKVLLESLLNRQIESFAYPNGDYDEESIALIRKIGYRTARTTDVGWNSRSTDPYRLKIVGVSDSGSLNKLSFELTGLSLYIQYLLKGNFEGRKV